MSAQICRKLLLLVNGLHCTTTRVIMPHNTDTLSPAAAAAAAAAYVRSVAL
jgi:hypothetical protein